jgi:hypothetical protein
MQFTEIMRAYFRGEATEAWFFILPAGLLLAASGVALLSANRTAFDWGFAVPAIIFGLILMGTGVGVGARTPGQVRTLEAAYQSDAAAMVKDELPRMQKVMRNFRTTLWTFGGLALLGLVLLFALRQEWAAGIGIALIAASAIGLCVDNIAERRAHPYVHALEEIGR